MKTSKLKLETIKIFNQNFADKKKVVSLHSQKVKRSLFEVNEMPM